MNQTIRGAKGFNSKFLFWFNPYTNHPAISVQFIVRRFMWQMSFPPGHVSSSFCLQSHAFVLAMVFVSNFINTVRCLPISDCATWLLTKGKLLQRRLKFILGTAWSSRGWFLTQKKPTQHIGKATVRCKDTNCKHAGPSLCLGQDVKLWKNAGPNSPATALSCWPRRRWSWMTKVKSWPFGSKVNLQKGVGVYLCVLSLGY